MRATMSTEASSAQKLCAHCGGSEFYLRDAAFAGHSGFAIPLGFMRAADCVVRVCGGCGMVQWFLKPHSLEVVKRKFEREDAKGLAGKMATPKPDLRKWS